MGVAGGCLPDLEDGRLMDDGLHGRPLPAGRDDGRPGRELVVRVRHARRDPRLVLAGGEDSPTSTGTHRDVEGRPGGAVSDGEHCRPGGVAQGLAGDLHEDVGTQLDHRGPGGVLGKGRGRVHDRRPRNSGTRRRSIFPLWVCGSSDTT